MMRILVAEDEKNVAYMLKAILEAEGWEVATEPDGRAALDRFLAEGADLVVTDLSMPRMDGMELLRAIRAVSSGTPVILLTARGNERVAIDAVRAGAWDYFRKPFDNAEVVASVTRALEVAALRRENAALRERTGVSLLFDPQRSPAMREAADTIDRIAKKDVTVLITGETGTGKEVAARLLHEKSNRAAMPFVAVNCGALQETLVEAELFGWEKGAFTGAANARAGFAEQAHGGTLFLDEIGDMPPPLQTKLLRVLQEGEIQRLGATKPKKVDVRVVAATHRELAAMVKEGRFREDLYYRLKVIEVKMPALRDRRADIPLLAKHFAARFAEKFAVGPVEADDTFLAQLAARAWPGNVRELAHEVERAVALSDGGVLGIPAEPADDSAREQSLPEMVEAFERDKILQALAAADGNQSAAARALGIARVTLIDKMKKYRLTANPRSHGT